MIPWTDVRIIPVYAALLSATYWASKVLFRGLTRPKNEEQGNAANDAPSCVTRDGRAYKLSTVASCVALAAISAASAIKEGSLVDAALSAPFCYATALAYASTSGLPYSQSASLHLNGVLLTTFVVYAARDLAPLALYGGHPSDRDGPLLWIAISLLFTAGILIPLFTPGKHTPINTKDPLPATPEQKASIMSFCTFTYLNPIISLAQRRSITLDDLPPISDTDDAGQLKVRTFEDLDMVDGNRKRHIFFALTKVFRWQYATLVLSLVVQVFTSFAAPLALNRILNYLEHGAVGTSVRPWFWVCLLFVGPLISSIALQWYIHLVIRTAIRAEAIITQLIYEHALRLRTNAGSTKQSASEVVAQPNSDNFLGRLNTLVTTDLQNVVNGRDFILILVYIPLNVVVGIVFLYSILGWSALVGLSVIILSLPLPGLSARLIQKLDQERLKRLDDRVQSITEVLSVIRMIKLFGWERKMKEKISQERDEELQYLFRRRIVEKSSEVIVYCIPIAVMLATYATYARLTILSTAVMREPLSAAIVFSSMAVFDILRKMIGLSMNIVTLGVTAKVSLDRIDAFLSPAKSDLLDAFDISRDVQPPTEPPSRDAIGFKHASFSWSDNTNAFELRVDGEVRFKSGKVNLIIGPTGSGKTSLLMALLGELRYAPTSCSSWVNLPRDAGVAYAAQESWVQSDTIKNNIVFGAPFDPDRYEQVLYQCALKRDLALFDAGDETEVGEKGVTLSGGQKARITLARAVYSSASILLLDDILAALDVHTTKWVVEKCLAGSLVQGRTVILVTHNIPLAQPLASTVIAVSSGHVTLEASIAAAISHDARLAKEVEEEDEHVHGATETLGEKHADETPTGKLVVEEEVEIGRITWSTFATYLRAAAGQNLTLFLVVWITALGVMDILGVSSTWFLGYWASQYEDYQPSEVNVSRYLGSFGLILLAQIIATVVSFMTFILGGVRASRVLHDALANSMLGATLRWLDQTPASRIITRFTSDMATLDTQVPHDAHFLCQLTIMLIVRLAAIVINAPLALVFGVVVGIAGVLLAFAYMRAQMPVTRETSKARAPVLAHFGASMAGLVSIRAYGAQAAMITTSIQHINQYTRAARISFDLQRWITIRMDALGAAFSTLLAIYLVYFTDTSAIGASSTGFSHNMAVGFSGMILFWVRMMNIVEGDCDSVERVNQCLKVEQERPATPEGQPPTHWPASGELNVRGLSASYSKGGPKVLRDISFHITSGERVGVVGRTGAGKSSLSLALLRCIECEGEVYYDGVSTASLNLEALRVSITIIPQVPDMISGSLRENLNPFDDHDDATLNDALRAAGLFALQEDERSGAVRDSNTKIDLDTKISSGGSNLSVGQRQIVALARALVRGSKLLILDEATSAIDYRTDSIIQESLRRHLGNDVTLMVIAHRLKTVMDADKIMVLDAGKLVEFDRPEALLAQQDSALRALVEESSDKEHLYKLAGIAV
ncbi:P-loop containing nucleoside triphosphate hydrolase protein [Schizophyllum commune H4-8]|uniref:P-loop containing nucleoside triphosphate hydrolase protein n=1 Tax=Schizophyllum commune (strain H4-8 / FGSC 9210) TaxID=578458 RepID=UPI002160A83C|nr:P-loop containing nucleoside triphosphate hydrolase protein [Schizophyllum commune H4-8]KAI5886386.1 P-loop containing nucleoside triphosphate hydrolase protein [Schizophyllum commune H4-8]